MTNQKLSERVTIRLSWADYCDLKAASARHGISPSEVLRLALREMMIAAGRRQQV